MTKVTFEVLVSSHGNIIRCNSSIEERHYVKDGYLMSGKPHYELREVVVKGDAEEAYKEAIKKGGMYWRTMKYTSL